jgi:anhydro-N-acetylmuramic acid kinase
MASPATLEPLQLVGVMSGTSLDGADAVLATVDGSGLAIVSHLHRPFPDELKSRLLSLQASAPCELDSAALAANQLAEHYAGVVLAMLEHIDIAPRAIRAVAVHGQTVRHRPELGYTIQLNAPARLAELIGIDVICDFRSRDVAAGGQGAPLVPAFHAAVFGSAHEHRAVVNLGGMANISDLPAGVNQNDGPVRGWDTGPGNVYLDAWYQLEHGGPFDRDGALAARGRINQDLLRRLLDDPWLAKPPPKSTGRDHFSAQWLARRLEGFGQLPREDVQATLAQFTAETIAEGLASEIAQVARVILSGGGAHNADLAGRIERALASRLARAVQVVSSASMGIPPEQVEAAAFAWLGARFLAREPGNRPGVTGARGGRVLGALYPA